MATASTAEVTEQSRKRLHSLCDDQTEYQQHKKALYKSLGHLSIDGGGLDGIFDVNQKNQPPGSTTVGEKRSYNFDEDSDTASNNGELSCEMDNVSINSDESGDTKPKIRRKRLSNPILPAENDADVAQLLASGRKKYQRRIDYLVDEVIRKSKRTSYQPSDGEGELLIPASVGPQPTTDQALLASYNSNWALQIYTNQQLEKDSLFVSLTGNSTRESDANDSTSDTSVDGATERKNVNDNLIDVTDLSENMDLSSAGDDQGMDEAIDEQDVLLNPSSVDNSVLDRAVKEKVRQDAKSSELLVSTIKSSSLKKLVPIERAHLAGDCTHTEWGIEELHR